MTEDDSCFVAASAFDVHEVGVGSGHESFQLVALSFSLEGGVKEVSVHRLLAKNIKNILLFNIPARLIAEILLLSLIISEGREGSRRVCFYGMGAWKRKAICPYFECYILARHAFAASWITLLAYFNVSIINSQLLVMFAPTPQTTFFTTQPQQYDQNTIQTQQSLLKITSSLDAVNQLQQQPQLQTLLVLLRALQQESLSCINKICSPILPNGDSIMNGDRTPSQSVATRFRSIKERNNDLLIKVLNLREKMIHQMYMYKVRSPKTESELDQISERIRHLKIKVNNKYTQLKYLKMTKEGKKSCTKTQYNYSQFGRPLEDLKKGAEVIEKETIRLREELSLIIKHLHGEQI